jgi:hypothetical protein
VLTLKELNTMSMVMEEEIKRWTAKGFVAQIGYTGC